MLSSCPVRNIVITIWAHLHTTTMSQSQIRHSYFSMYPDFPSWGCVNNKMEAPNMNLTPTVGSKVLVVILHVNCLVQLYVVCTVWVYYTFCAQLMLMRNSQPTHHPFFFFLDQNNLNTHHIIIMISQNSQQDSESLFYTNRFVHNETTNKWLQDEAC